MASADTLWLYGLLALTCAGCGSTPGGAADSDSGPQGGGANTGGSSTGGQVGTGGVSAGGSQGTGGHAAGGAGGSTPAICARGPALTAGVWTNITPPGLDLTTTFGVNDVQVAPSDPCIVYTAVDQNGMYKSTDGGSTWRNLGTGTPSYETSTTILDSPLHMRVDPNDAQHLYAVQGVRGKTQGFWVSKDGGETWNMPAAFSTGASLWTRDAYSVNFEPGNFDHILVTFHCFSWSNNSVGDTGVIESTDGGTTWVTHYQAGFSHGNVATFLDNGQTWLLGTQDKGIWRTSDGGTTWKQVETEGMSHGGMQVYRSKVNDALYMGIWNGLLRSTDDGVTWTSLKNGIDYTGYMSVIGDGKNLYTQRACACLAIQNNTNYLTSPESDGLTWTPYAGGQQKFDNGPFGMSYAPGPGIIYSANWDAGLWALKLP